MPAGDAVILDSTNLSIDEVIARALEVVEQRRARGSSVSD